MIGISPITLHLGVILKVLPIDPLVAKYPAYLKNFFKPANKHLFQRKFQ